MKNCVNGMIGAIAGGAIAVGAVTSASAQLISEGYGAAYIADQGDFDPLALLYPNWVDGNQDPDPDVFSSNDLPIDILAGDTVSGRVFAPEVDGTALGLSIVQYLASSNVDNGDGTATQTLRIGF
ncbi:MAG: hypothetical protein AAGB34_11175, partial [Planctomycetota bacterium]